MKTEKQKMLGGELYDPLIHGETVGEVIGSADWISGKGLRINSNTSYVRYLEDDVSIILLSNDEETDLDDLREAIEEVVYAEE